MIKFDKLFAMLDIHNINPGDIRKENLIGQRSWGALKDGKGGLHTDTIGKLCRRMNCQPGDLMEYVPDEE